MLYKLSIPEINKHDKIWLQEIYEISLNGEKVSVPEIWGRLHDRLPQFYRPERMNNILINSLGDEIKICGVMALQKSKSILKKADKIIYCIRNIILDNTLLEEIEFSEVALKTNTPINEVSFLFRLVCEYGCFYKGGLYQNNSTQFKSITIKDDIKVFYSYKEFPGIESLVYLSNKTRKVKEDDFFNYDEIIYLVEKIDNLQNDIDHLKTGQEIIWTDVMQELDEMKCLFKLSKRNWRQILLGKLTEMVIGGIISETISKNILALINPITHKLINHKYEL